jgi:hypothetical protein
MAQANLQREAGFLTSPHPVLYPCVWEAGGGMRPEARDRILRTFLDLAEVQWPDVRSWVRFAVIGSGASYNWDEDGDLDVQVWVADEDRLADVRRLIVAHLLHRTCADLGLTTIDCQGRMEVQFFAKPGRGTVEENLAGQPYACYDMDLDRWLVDPIPLTPDLYGNLFLLVEPRAEEVAAEAEVILAAYDRARRDADYWVSLSALGPGFEERATRAQHRLVERHAEVKALYKQLVAGRSGAYSAEGRGIYDERDAIWKLLEVWGINPRLKNVAQGTP